MHGPWERQQMLCILGCKFTNAMACCECRSEVLGTPETPMPQVRPLMPPPLFDAAQVPGTSAAHAAQQPSHGAHGPAADAQAPAAMDDIQASPQLLLS